MLKSASSSGYHVPQSCDSTPLLISGVLKERERSGAELLMGS